MGIRSGVLIAVLSGLLALGLSLALGPEPADRMSLRGSPELRAAEDPARRAAIDGFYDTWLRNQKVNIGWTGDVSECRPGAMSDAALAATQSQISYYRTLAGLRPVTLDQELDRVAQRTALMMDANNQLSHDPPAWWKCQTSAGSDLAGRSNLALGFEGTGARAISRYMVDAALTSVAHRRWVLNPRTAEMAAGSTADASALVVVGMPQHKLAVPAWIPWPAAGYFPSPLQPKGMWSLSTTLSGIDFSRARIRVTDDAGNRYEVKKFRVVAAGGAPTLVWRVYGLRSPSLRRDVTYHVRVRRIERARARLSGVGWTVTLVKPDRSTALVDEPVIRGTFQVGSQLTVSSGTWSPAATSWAYQWLRNGAPIPGATNPFYVLTTGDRGRTISAVVSAKADYYAPGKTTVPGGPVGG